MNIKSIKKMLIKQLNNIKDDFDPLMRFMAKNKIALIVGIIGIVFLGGFILLQAILRYYVEPKEKEPTCI
jgi:uncharacterized membrane protein